ncbi:MAG: glycine cleavage system aminomethyltransferase GcvT [Nitrospinaceae bacterium]
MTESAPLKATPLLDLHRELKGKLVPFAGWNMPVQYAGVIAEHLCVRRAAGLFDISHMGEIEVTGTAAGEFLQYLVTNDVHTLPDGAALYTVMCYPDGGVVDDLLVYRITPEHYFLCVNAANTDKDLQWVREKAGGFDVQVKDISSQTAQFALQGPLAETVLQSVCAAELAPVPYFRFVRAPVCGVDCLIARTGYTGEDGFELYLESGRAREVFAGLLQAGRPHGLQPAGLGARDTLRLEMGYPLYGHELGPGIHPLEARLGWVVKLGKAAGFIGKEALQKIKDEGRRRKLVGLRLLERGVPRPPYPVSMDGKPVGEVTSGTHSPSLDAGIALALVSAEGPAKDADWAVEIRGRAVPAAVVSLPFVPSHVKK